MFKESILSFRKLCFHTIKLPEGLQAKLGKIISKEANTTDLFPFFLNHAYELYPHLKCMDELKIQSNLAEPAYWWLINILLT
jgi:ATP-dependent RNA helicase SUPV3L1/SUV3